MYPLNKVDKHTSKLKFDKKHALTITLKTHILMTFIALQMYCLCNDLF